MLWLETARDSSLVGFSVLSSPFSDDDPCTMFSSTDVGDSVANVASVVVFGRRVDDVVVTLAIGPCAVQQIDLPSLFFAHA